VAGPPDLFAGRADLAGRLTAWVASARTDDAAAARAREAFLRRTGPEDATFAAVLLDLAERGAPVLATTTTGRRHRGVVTGVGHDFAAVRTPEGRDVVLAHRGIAAVAPEGARATAPGDRATALPLGLAEALAVLAEDRPRVLVVASGGEPVAGELTAVGRDVLTVRLDGGDRRVTYVATDNVVEVSTA
jgi:hypothetical protein